MDRPNPLARSTKIIATLGPSSRDRDVVHAMVDAGMDVARINFSHVTDADEVHRMVAIVRDCAQQLDRPVAVLGDLCGPKMRLRNVPGGAVDLTTGDRFLLYPVGVTPPADHVPAFAVSIPTLCEDCRPGHRVLVADGTVVGEIESVQATSVQVRVTTGGPVLERKGVNLPDTQLQGAALTAKDRADIATGVDAGIDVFALSFTRTASDVDQLRAMLPEHTPVIAKIERPEALGNFTAICESADGVMVARGDLGVEVGWEALPGLQMDLVAEASDRGRLSVVATEMLESMTHAARPTRAEVADVASAVMDGASAVMLSAETASGADPVLVVRTMGSILAGIEAHTRYRSRNVGQRLGPKAHHRPAAIAAAATHLARDIDAAAIVAIASTGAAARMISSARPPVPVVALCQHPEVARHLALWWGVHPHHVPPGRIPDDRIRALVRASSPATPGPVVIVSGSIGGSYSDRLRILDV